MTGLAAPLLGLVIGLVMGMLGGGGSVLAVPVLIYVVGQTPQAATHTSLLIVVVTSLGGLVGHWRAGHVRWLAGAAFGLAGLGGSVAGTRMNAMLSPTVLLAAFALLAVVAAVGMLRQGPADTPPAAPGARGKTATRAHARTVASVRARIDGATLLRLLVAGTAVGLLTGLFGVGGGFVVVPTLVLWLGFPMAEAVGTSLVVIVLNALMALGARVLTGSQIAWDVAVPLGVAGLAGALAGAALARRMRAEGLGRGFAVLLLAVAGYMLVDAVLLG